MLGNVDLKFYLSIFLRRLPYFVVIAAFLTAIGIAVASILPPVYRSTATILVEAPQIPGELAQSTVPIDPVEQIQIIEQRLMTRANILSLADRFDVYADQPGISANTVINDMRARTELTPTAPGPARPRGDDDRGRLLLGEPGPGGGDHQRARHPDPAGERQPPDRPGRGHARVLRGRGRPALGRARPDLAADDGLQEGERDRAARQPRLPPQPAGDAAGAAPAVRARGDRAAGRARPDGRVLPAHRPDAERGPGHPRGAGARGRCAASSPGRRRSIPRPTRTSGCSRPGSPPSSGSSPSSATRSAPPRACPSTTCSSRRSTGGSSSSPRRRPGSRRSSRRSRPRSRRRRRTSSCSARCSATTRTCKASTTPPSTAWPPPRSASGSR